MMRRYGLLIAVFFFVTLMAGCSEEAATPVKSKKAKAAAKAPKKVKAAAVEKATEPKKEKFIYNSKGLRDPFVPLTAIERPLGDPNAPITPLQKYDLAQYRLIGVVIGRGEPRALVVSPDKKSYILKRGEKIGKNGGVVIDVTSESVLVEERYYDFSDTVRTRMQEIKVPEREGV